jgi:hypothetical protein
MTTRFRVRFSAPSAILDTSTDRIQAHLQNLLGARQTGLMVEEVQTKSLKNGARIGVQATILIPLDVNSERIEEWLVETLEQDQSAMRPSVMTMETLPTVSVETAPPEPLE